MSLINSVSPNGTVSGPLPNASSQALTVATSVAETSPNARALLQSAVVATNLVPSYQEPKAVKVVVRAPSNAPSSQLAAQYLSQTPEPSDDELAIFTPREQPQSPTQSPQQQETPQADDFLAALRTARGNVPATTPQALQTQVAAQQATANPAAASNVLNFAAQNAGITFATAKPVTSNDARGLPNLAVNIVGRKPGLALSRGASAYQLTESRNQSSSLLSAGVDSIL